MAKSSLSLRDVNKALLLVTLGSLALNLEKGSFSRNFVPSLFQALLVALILLTIIYVVSQHKVRDFFSSIPKKVWLCIGMFYALTIIGWLIAIFSLGIPTTLTTILDFGTFTMGIVLFVLVSFYAKDDQQYARWCLYAILIPNLHLIYYFLTHGLVGYWGVPNDFSLDHVLDPNILSKTLIVPAMVFISMTLFAVKDKKWQKAVLLGLLGAIASMMIFWTVSRGASLTLILSGVLTWLVFSWRGFNWKKCLTSGVVVLLILLLGYGINPHNTKQAITLKTANTFTLPAASGGKVADVTVAEIQKLPQTESRLIIWHLYPTYILHHPFGVGPNSAHDFNFHDKDGVHIYYGPDSTYLVIALWGGLLGLAVYLYLLWSAFVVLWEKWKRSYNGYTLALMSTLFALSVALFFDGNLSLYWFYVVLALSFLEYAY
jgi:O-antigen ligase